jgi:hypothetical protein
LLGPHAAPEEKKKKKKRNFLWALNVNLLCQKAWTSHFRWPQEARALEIRTQVAYTLNLCGLESKTHIGIFREVGRNTNQEGKQG